MKCAALFILAAVGIVAAQGTPEKGVAKEKSSLTTQKPAAPYEEHSAPGVTVIVKQENTPVDKPPATEDEENIRIQRKLARFTEWLVGVGLLQALILAFTIWAINKQTTTNQHIERAWVMVDVTCDYGSELMSESSSGDVSTALGDTKIKCHNTGRSPGWITEKVVKLAVLPKRLPEHLALDDPKTVIAELEPISPGQTTEEKFEMIQAPGRHSFTGGTVLAVYGRVSYRDIFNKNRDTWFCYRVKGQNNARRLTRMEEYPQYNKNT